MFRWFRERSRLRAGGKFIDQFDQKLEREIDHLKVELYKVWEADPVYPQCDKFQNTIQRLSGKEVTPEIVYNTFERSLNALMIENREDNLEQFKEKFVEIIEFEESPLRGIVENCFPENEAFFSHYFSRDAKQYELELETACEDLLDDAQIMLKEMIELKQLLAEALPQHKKKFKTGFLAGLGNVICGGIDIVSNVVRTDDTSVVQMIASDLFVSKINNNTRALRETLTERGLKKAQDIMDHFLDGFADLSSCADRYNQSTRRGLEVVIDKVIACETQYHKRFREMFQEMLDAGIDVAALSPYFDNSHITYHCFTTGIVR